MGTRNLSMFHEITTETLRALFTSNFIFRSIINGRQPM
jgi:hypothetical protein